jgi:phosphate/sulfate permease
MDSHLAIVIISLVFAALVSAFVANICFQRLKREVLKKNHKQNNNHSPQLDDKICELRLSSYPRAFEITDQLGSQYLFKNKISTGSVKQIREDLIEWNKALAGFVLSEKSLKTFYKLREALDLNSSHNHFLNQERLEKIWKAKSQFRACLREDVNLTSEEDEPAAS